jgi:hypothetical protein
MHGLSINLSIHPLGVREEGLEVLLLVLAAQHVPNAKF